MSARLFKNFCIILFAHIIIFSLLWVGFPVPLGHPSADFVYFGSSTGMESGTSQSHITNGMNVLRDLPFDHAESSAPWIQLRQVDKPRT